MISATQLRVGFLVMHNGKPHRVTAMTHRTPGNLRGFVQATLVNIENGSKNEHRFSSEDKLERATLDEHNLQYSYRAGDEFQFMNTDSYEQIGLHAEELGDDVGYLLPETAVRVEFFEERPISVTIPQVVELTVVETEPEIKGATVSNVGKPAKLETGITIQVPAFIKEGEKIRVDTTEGRYIERAK